MSGLKQLVLAAAIAGGGALAAGAASAAPVPSNGLAAAAAATAPVETVQWGYYGYGGPRHYYGGPGYGYYGPRRYWGGPPVVCRWRPSPWGPRRVCFRRY